MQLALELLAPARNKDIGTAAVSCGADAVYMAGPSFGAREAAGNTMDDIAETVRFAHRFGSRIYLTVNTILYEKEIPEAEAMIRDAVDAGVDALIVQDFAVLKMDIPPIPLFASTQCDIRMPEQAKMLESLGFQRLILARELSLDQIKSIQSAVKCDLESFVHGALCVSYSGQCYLSRCLTGRSANRGECAQACRSLYDLVDGDGNVLLKDESVLSLKDLRLDDRILELADAGISSFKIEGRLKNASYVKNVVRHYRNVVDEVIAANPDKYCKASWGTLHGGFTPDVDATFNRGFTHLFIDGKRGDWSSADTAKATGELIGTISRLVRNKTADSASFVVEDGKKPISNGDGLMFVTPDGTVGMRADVVELGRITVKDTPQLCNGAKVYRNYNIRFEKELENDMPRRLLDVAVDYSTKEGRTTLKAHCEDGTEAEIEFSDSADPARNKERAEESMREQMSKTALHYSFALRRIESDTTLFYAAATVNGWRRELAERLAIKAEQADKARIGDLKRLRRVAPSIESGMVPEHLTYLANCSNSLSEQVLEGLGAHCIDPAYELEPAKGSQLMRTKYCIRYRMGICRKTCRKKIPEPLYLVNNGKKLRLEFDCERCEMLVIW
jgi:collagenase-like PrtC family protease